DDKKQNNFIEIYQDDDNRPNHTFVFGSTGVGKTRLLEGIMEQDIRKNQSVVIIDPKGDIALFSKMVQIAKECGREKDIMFISSIFPEYSLKINPLNNYFIDEEIIANIVSGVPAQDEFFLKVAQETTTAIVKALNILRRINNNNEPLTFEEIAQRAHYKGIKYLQDELIESVNEDSLLLNDKESIRILNLLEQILSSNQDYFSKVTTTLRTTLTEMSVGNIGKIIGNVKTNRFIDRLEEDKPVLLYVMTGSMLTRQSSAILSKVIISMIQCCVGKVVSSGRSFKHRLNVYIDEAASSVYRGIEVLFAQGRSSNLNLTALTQSLADMVAEIGQERADKLFDLTNTKIIMRINEQKSAELISDMGGKKSGYSYFLNLEGGINSREVEELNIEADDITQLQKREFYYFGFEGRFKGKTAPVSAGKYEIIFPDISNKAKRGGL
ncbi:DUF87 domain-containing protein, partial [Helicobacter apodemus]